MYYFASDMHLGLEHESDTRQREKLVVQWLEEVAADADAIILVGDVFDFWFEYKRVVPKGFTRLLGKLSELTDRGVQIHFFPGNHDMWAYDYLNTECGVILHDKPEVFELNGKMVFVAHGDNLYSSKRPFMERFMQSMFRSRFMRVAASVLVHPNQMMRFGTWWSGKSRKAKNLQHKFRGEEEYLVKYARDYCKVLHVDYFIFGHIHCAEDYDLGNSQRVIFLGEWISDPSYAVMNDAGEMELRKYS